MLGVGQLNLMGFTLSLAYRGLLDLRVDGEQDQTMSQMWRIKVPPKVTHSL